MDYENSSWWQELDADNKVTTKVGTANRIFITCCIAW